jgi:hypothetical protein
MIECKHQIVQSTNDERSMTPTQLITFAFEQFTKKWLTGGNQTFVKLRIGEITALNQATDKFSISFESNAHRLEESSSERIDEAMQQTFTSSKMNSGMTLRERSHLRNSSVRIRLFSKRSR